MYADVTWRLVADRHARLRSDARNRNVRKRNGRTKRRVADPDPDPTSVERR